MPINRIYFIKNLFLLCMVSMVMFQNGYANHENDPVSCNSCFSWPCFSWFARYKVHDSKDILDDKPAAMFMVKPVATTDADLSRGEDVAFDMFGDQVALNSNLLACKPRPRSSPIWVQRVVRNWFAKCESEKLFDKLLKDFPGKYHVTYVSTVSDAIEEIIKDNYFPDIIFTDLDLEILNKYSDNMRPFRISRKEEKKRLAGVDYADTLRMHHYTGVLVAIISDYDRVSNEVEALFKKLIRKKFFAQTNDILDFFKQHKVRKWVPLQGMNNSFNTSSELSAEVICGV